MRSLGVKTAIDKAMTGDFKAGQWLADKGFIEDKKRGRPSQRDRQNEKAFQEKVQQQYGSDIDRLKNLQ
jgi:hypothetical protein